MRALDLGAFLQHRRASGPRRHPTSGPRPRVPHVADPGCVGVEASTPHQPWVPSRDSSGTPVGTLLGVFLPPYACSALPPLRARVKGRVGVSPRERETVRVRVGCGWCSTRGLSLCAVAGWPQHNPKTNTPSRRGVTMPASPRCSLILTRPEAKQLSPHIPTLASSPRPLPSHRTDDAKDYYTSRTTRAKAPDDCNRLSAATRTKRAATDERVPTRASARECHPSERKNPARARTTRTGKANPIPKPKAPPISAHDRSRNPSDVPRRPDRGLRRPSPLSLSRIYDFHTILTSQT